MRIESKQARFYYLKEAAEQGWNQLPADFIKDSYVFESLNLAEPFNSSVNHTKEMSTQLCNDLQPHNLIRTKTVTANIITQNFR